MSQPLMIRIDASALAALFPPDSPGRVELQAAVIAEFVRKNFKDAAFGADVRDKLERARADGMEEVRQGRNAIMGQMLSDAGLKKDYSNFRLAGEAQATVRAAAIAVVRNEANKAATDAVEASMATLKHDIDAAVERRVRAITDVEIRAAVKRQIDAVMSGLAAPVAAA